jgi:hypothetical protein
MNGFCKRGFAKEGKKGFAKEGNLIPLWKTPSLLSPFGKGGLRGIL